MELSRFLEVCRHKKFVPVAGVTAGLLFVLGFYFAFVRPGQLVENARQQASSNISNAEKSLKDAELELEKMDWFKKSYLTVAIGNLAEATDLIGEARENFSQASQQGSWRKKVERFKSGCNKAVAATDKTKVAQDSLIQAQERKERALAQGAALTHSLKQISSNLQDARIRIKAESPRYPSRYGRTLTQRDSTDSEESARIAAVRQRGMDFLPGEAEADGRGDPDSALAILDPAVESANKLQNETTSFVEYLLALAVAHERADSLVSESESRYGISNAELAKRKAGGLWLKEGTAILASAEADALSARRLLTLIEDGEKVPDRPEAYFKAQRAIERANLAVSNADQEIALFETTKKNERSLAAEIVSATGLIPQVSRDFDTLKKYHNEELWLEQASIATSLTSIGMTQANGRHAQVQRLLSLGVQKFKEADELVQAELTSVRNMQAQANAFFTLVKTLEGARSSYRNEYSSASSAIAGERDQIESYGSYDFDAQSDFNRSVSLLSRAAGEAQNRRYQLAISYAQQARRLVAGVGDRAEEAYDDAQDDDSSFDFGGGMSDSDSSFGGVGFGGGSDFGGGGYGGGSDSSFGGGSDSSFGGGSDSDF